MIDTRFGRAPSSLLTRLRPMRIDVSDLREVAAAVLPSLATERLRPTLVDRPASGSVVVLEEDERRVHMPLAVLADDMAAAGVAPTREAMGSALEAWVDDRPVTDAAAAETGIAVLDWSDGRRIAVGRRVVVRRGDRAVPWTPSTAAGGRLVHRTRSVATGRAHDVDLDLLVQGPVALWSHAAVPLLATSALIAPGRMLQRMQAAGLGGADLSVVVTPGRPVACARAAVAARLAGETSEACVTLPSRRLADVPWL